MVTFDGIFNYKSTHLLIKINKQNVVGFNFKYSEVLLSKVLRLQTTEKFLRI
jgi:hypothetical protein